MQTRFRHCVSLLICFCWFLHGPVLGQSDPKVLDRALPLFGFKPEQKEALLRGETLTNDPKESTPKELAVAVAALMPGTMTEVVDLVRTMKINEIDAEILKVGPIHPTAVLADFQPIQYAGDELEELDDLLKVSPGSDFNLSSEEIARFENLRKKLGRANPEKDPAAAEAVLDTYRQVLLERCLAYQKGGLQAIAPYQRKGSSVASPSEELAKALQSEDLAGPTLTPFIQALQHFPKDLPEGLESSFVWIKQRVEKRPCLILNHRLILEKETHALMAARQFFVGHNFNSLQVLVGCLPVDNGVVVLYRNRTSTDQVAGFGSDLRHKIGRGMMREEILKKFETVRKALKKN